MTSSTRLHWPSAIQFSLGSIAALLFLGGGLALLGAGLSQFLEGIPIRAIDALPFVTSAALFSIGLLALPSGIFGFARLLRRPITPRFRISWFSLRYSIWLLPIVVGIGYLVSEVAAIAWFLLPAFHVLAIGVPLLWYLSIGGRHLEPQSAQRKWGAFGGGMGLSLFPILILEGLIGIVFLAIMVALRSEVPGFMDDFESIVQAFFRDNFIDQGILIEFLEQYFLDARILGLGGVYVAFIVPLVEEAFKPIGIFFLNRKSLTPAGGFIAGMLSGAGFAFIESVLQTGTGEDWWMLVSGRIGTGLIHITNSGLVGWGIALAISQRAYLRLAGHYLLAVVIHGLWNGLAVLAALGYTPDLEIQGLEGLSLEQVGSISAVFLLVLAGATMLVLIRANRLLRPASGLLQSGAKETEIIQGIETEVSEQDGAN